MTENGTMQGNGSVVESLYSRLILRDLFGKIVPGTIALVALLYPFIPNFQTETIFLTSWFGFLFMGIVAGASWLTGFAIQALGECSGWTRYFPKALDKVGWRTIRAHYMNDLDGKEISSIDNATTVEERYQEFLDDYARAKKNSSQGQQAERLTVIKEACGNGYLALSVGILLFIVYRAVDMILLQYVCCTDAQCTASFVKNLVIFVVIVSIAYYLQIAHTTHTKRAFTYMLRVMKPDQEAMSTPDGAADGPTLPKSTA